uniref:Reverse transcriptase Ty1/copia-type domain-containing protein n=1 Tax=Fagus sylvatica TaxID=28930 RepID=A0A2N9FFC2_FAGSY
MVSEPTIMDPVANNPSPLLLLNNMSNLMSIKLDSMNYMLWKLQISAILDAYSMIEHLDGSTQQPRQFIVNEDGDQTLNPAFLIWRKKDKALLTLLLSTLSSPVLAMVVGTTTAQEVWNRLEEKFTCTARANVLNLKLELQGIKKGNDSINSYLQRIKNTRDKLSAVGVLVDNEELLHMVLKGLPKEFSSFASAIRTRDDAISFEKLSVLLQTEEQSMAAVSDPFPNSALAMFVSNNQKPHNGFNGGFTGNQGYNRGRGGRYSSNRGRGGRSFGPNPSYPSYPNPQMPQSSTPQPSSQFNPQGRTERPTCQICWKIGHYAVDCYHRMDFAYQGKNPPTKLAAMASASNLQYTQGSETWLTDTGASDHITSNASNLSSPTPYQGSEQVTVGNGQHLPIQSIVHKLCLENNCSCHFDAKKLLIQDLPTGRLLYKGLSKDGVYPIHSSQFCSSASPKSAYLTSSSALKWQLWHSRLGHPSAKVLHSIFPSLSPCNTLDFNSVSNHCKHCLAGKMHQLPFPVSTNKVTKPFQLVHADLWGPAPSVSLNASLQTLHTATPQASIPTGLDCIPTLPQPFHPNTLPLPSASVLPSSPNQSPAFPLPVCCPDSRVTVPTPATILPNVPNVPESNILPNVPSPIPPQIHLHTSQHPMQTRSKSGIYKPKLGYAAQVDYTVTEPPSHKIAAQHSSWCTAMEEEFAALQKQGTWSLVPPPPHKNIVGCKWVYKLKRHSDGTIARYKARLVAKGFHQQQGVDYDETFSPVVKPPTEVYMAQPPGYVDSTNSHYVCKLHKSIYGLKQAPRAWFDSFTTQLLHLGFTASTADSSLFIYHYKGVIAYLLLYVDDIVLTSNSTPFLDHLILQLSQVFDIKDLGTLHYFLGIQVVRTSENLLLTQTKYASDLLLKHHMVDSKPAKTPCSPNTRLSLHEGDVLSDPHGYRSLVGALHYLTFTRPDISFAVHQVCQYMSTPTSTHLTAAKRILRYIKGTLHHGIAFTPGPLSLSVYSDADWAGDPDDRRSTSGLLIYLGSNPITWSAKKQPTVSRSSTESEYRALATASAEVCWIRTLLKELGIYLSQPPTLWCDNVSALAIASNPVFHARTKHIEVDFHFIRERVLRKDLVVKFVSTIDQLADIFTKSLPTQRFLDLQRNLTVSISLSSVHILNVVSRGGQKTVEPDPPDKSGRPARPPPPGKIEKLSHSQTRFLTPLILSLTARRSLHALPHGATSTPRPHPHALTLLTSRPHPHALPSLRFASAELPRLAQICLDSPRLDSLAQISLTSSQPVGFVCRSVMVL